MCENLIARSLEIVVWWRRFDDGPGFVGLSLRFHNCELVVVVSSLRLPRKNDDVRRRRYNVFRPPPPRAEALLSLLEGRVGRGVRDISTSSAFVGTDDS